MLEQRGTKLNKVQFNFGDKALKELDDLKEQIGASSRAETIRLALKIMKWLADEKAKGHPLHLEDERGIHPLIILGL